MPVPIFLPLKCYFSSTLFMPLYLCHCHVPLILKIVENKKVWRKGLQKITLSRGNIPSKFFFTVGLGTQPSISPIPQSTPIVSSQQGRLCFLDFPLVSLRVVMLWSALVLVLLPSGPGRDRCLSHSHQPPSQTSSCVPRHVCSVVPHLFAPVCELLVAGAIGSSPGW